MLVYETRSRASYHAEISTVHINHSVCFVGHIGFVLVHMLMVPMQMNGYSLLCVVFFKNSDAHIVHT